ncbi:MAG: hypothetical protein JWM37_891 [Candidatus Saccharibacteria bacterium]|nr:hypothetical protein [Candidatus Saccharibacteria bacterium]
MKLRRKSTKRRLLRFGLVGFNALVLVGVSFFVITSPSSNPVVNNQVSADSGANNPTVSPLDQLSAASVAVNVAKVSNLAEANAVKNQADTVNAEMTIMPASDNVVSKPQVVSTALKSVKDVQTYVAKEGDTVSALAVTFGVSSDSIKWSNGLSSDAIRAGTSLTIPPVNGFTYTVKASDTAQSLAQKYNANADQITAFNDAEITGLKVGSVIVIPNGQMPVLAIARGNSFNKGSNPTYGTNGYDYGYCTYWVANLRNRDGNPVPNNLGNASSWGYLARSYGLPVGNTPKVGAAAVTSTKGAGHVVYITGVNDDGSVTVSEMNHAGWNVVNTRTFGADQAAGFTYIY